MVVKTIFEIYKRWCDDEKDAENTINIYATTVTITTIKERGITRQKRKKSIDASVDAIPTNFKLKWKSGPHMNSDCMKSWFEIDWFESVDLK